MIRSLLFVSDFSHIARHVGILLYTPVLCFVTYNKPSYIIFVMFRLHVPIINIIVQHGMQTCMTIQDEDTLLKKLPVKNQEKCMKIYVSYSVYMFQP
jgi:hypothetical protein